MKRWIVSDLHFDHANIIQYSNRPYNDITHMEVELIAGWNSVVAPEDVVYFLGDFAMGRHSFLRDKRLFDSLAGEKHMIIGNHDINFKTDLMDGNDRLKVTKDNAIEYWEKVGFKSVSLEPIILDDYFILSHAPINGLNNRQIMANIHGHTHDVSLAGGNYFNACVENINYMPIDFEVIKESFNAKN